MKTILWKATFATTALSILDDGSVLPVLVVLSAMSLSVLLCLVMVKLTRLSPANGQPETSPAAAVSHSPARSGQGDKSESREDPEPLQHRDFPQ